MVYRARPPRYKRLANFALIAPVPAGSGVVGQVAQSRTTWRELRRAAVQHDTISLGG